MISRLIIPTTLFSLIALICQSAASPAFADNQGVAYNIVCTKIEIHICTFYNLALTEPIIKELSQENLAENLYQTVNSNVTTRSKLAICFPSKEEIENLLSHISKKLEEKYNSKKLKYEYMVQLDHRESSLACAEKRYFIRFEPKNQQFSNISFEYDGIHIDMMLSRDEKLPLKELFESSSPLVFFPNIKESYEMLDEIQNEIGDYVIRNHFQEKSKSIENLTERDIRFHREQNHFIIYYEFEQTAYENIRNLEKYLVSRDPNTVFSLWPKESENVESMSFDTVGCHYKGFVEPKDIFVMKDSKSHEGLVNKYLKVALACHFSTLLNWEEPYVYFWEKLENFNPNWWYLYKKEINELERLERNLLALRETLPELYKEADEVVPTMLSLLGDDLKQIDLMDRMRGASYATYVTRKSQNLALIGISLTIILSTISLIISVVTFYFLRKPMSLRPVLILILALVVLLFFIYYHSSSFFTAETGVIVFGFVIAYWRYELSKYNNVARKALSEFIEIFQKEKIRKKHITRLSCILMTLASFNNTHAWICTKWIINRFTGLDHNLKFKEKTPRYFEELTKITEAINKDNGTWTMFHFLPTRYFLEDRNYKEWLDLAIELIKTCCSSKTYDVCKCVVFLKKYVHFGYRKPDEKERHGKEKNEGNYLFDRNTADKEFNRFIERQGLQDIDKHISDIFSNRKNDVVKNIREDLGNEGYSSEQINLVVEELNKRFNNYS